METPSSSACGAIILKASNPSFFSIHNESFVHEKVAVATYPEPGAQVLQKLRRICRRMTVRDPGGVASLERPQGMGLHQDT